MRAEIQTSGEPVRALARKYGVNPKTIAKWRRRAFVADRRPDRGRGRSRVLLPSEQAMCLAFRKHALLPLDDCLYALQLKIPHLTRASLHRLYRRHGISRLPAIEEKSGVDRLGDVYIDTSPIRTSEGLVYMYVAFDRGSRLAFADLYETQGPDRAVALLEQLVDAVPYRLRSILTSDVAEFSDPDGSGRHPFALACRRHGLEHNLVPSADPWTIAHHPGRSGSAIEPAPYRHFARHADLREHFFGFFDTYNFARRLKTLDGRTPYAFVCGIWRRNPERFRHSPLDRFPKLTSDGPWART